MLSPDLIASCDPNAIAIAPDLSYRAFDSLIGKTRSFLESQGVKSSSVVCIFAHLRPDTLCFLFAAWRLRCAALLISPKISFRERQILLERIKPAFIAPESLPDLPFDASPDAFLDLDVPALLLQTSGSSGIPKLASFTLAQLLDSANTVASALAAKPGDSWLLSIPLHHVGGLGVALRAFASAGTLVFEDKTLPLSRRILGPNARFASLVPTQLYRLVKEEIQAPRTHFLIGGAPLSQSLYDRAVRAGYCLFLTYGLTEMSSTVLLCNRPTWRDGAAYLGHPLPNRRMRLADREILVQGNSLCSGYWGQSPFVRSDWFPTKDLGRFDPLNGFAIDGRKDLQFLCGGENIQPEEIEAALLSHPEIAAACVIPKFDPEFGARPFAFVQTNLSFEIVRSFLADRLPKYKIPIAFASFPEDRNLKPNRTELIEYINKNYPFV